MSSRQVGALLRPRWLLFSEEHAAERPGAGKPLPAVPAKTVLYCEGNTDGTIGGSYFSLLYLVEGLCCTGYRPMAAFHRAHALLPRFNRACTHVQILEKTAPFQFFPPGSLLGRLHPVAQSPLRAFQRALNLAKFCGEVLRYAIFLRQRHVSLLHLNNSVTRTHDWMLAAWLTRTPWIVHERGINDRFSFMATWLARRASAIICISEAVRANLTEHRIGKGNLRVIENGLDPARVEPLSPPEDVRRSLGIEARRRVIGLVGNIKHWKGQEVLVRALPAIVAKVPDVVCLFVGSVSEFGPDRHYEEKLRDLVRKLGLERHVIFTGYREDVAGVLNLMEVLIHASILPEPFGRVLLEAMAMRKPTVGSRAGAVPEIIDHGVTGYTFAPGDADALASYVSDLLEHPSVARALGEAGHARLLERFSITANVSRTVCLYDEVLHSAP